MVENASLQYRSAKPFDSTNRADSSSVMIDWQYSPLDDYCRLHCIGLSLNGCIVVTTRLAPCLSPIDASKPREAIAMRSHLTTMYS